MPTSSAFVGQSELLPMAIEHLHNLTPGNLRGLIQAQELIDRLNILGFLHLQELAASRSKKNAPSATRGSSQFSLHPPKWPSITPSLKWSEPRLPKPARPFLRSTWRTPQQRMASCIPAMVNACKSGDLAHLEEVLTESFDLELDTDDDTSTSL